MSQELSTNAAPISPLASADAFRDAWKIATCLSSSSLVPAQFQGKPENVIIAMDMAQRMGAGAMAVMQSLHVIHGRPGLSAQFLIATFNATGRWTRLRFVFEGAGNDRSCYAEATELSTGITHRGTTITMAMAVAEKWATKPESKWRTMPDQMFVYRSAAFFIRAYEPGISLGMPTADEVADAIDADFSVVTKPAPAEIYAVKSKSEANSADAVRAADIDAIKTALQSAVSPETVIVDGATVAKATGEVLQEAPAAETAQEAQQAQVAETRDDAPAKPADAAPAGAQEARTSGGEFGADLTQGQVRQIRSLATRKGRSVQDVVDFIGGQINAGSINRAVAWLESQKVQS